MDRFNESSISYDNDQPKTDVVSFLHRAGERYKEHLQLLQRQQEEEQRRVAPGKPLVSPFANDWYQQTTRRGEAVEERLHKLHQKRKEKENAARLRAHQERDEAEMKEVRSTLEITEMAKAHPARNPAEVTEKFLADHRKNLQRLAEEAIGRELRDVQAAPKVTALASTPKTLSRKQGRHIEDHLIAVEQERRQKLFQKVEAKKIVPPDHFKPQITQRARSLQPVGNVVERLYTRNNNAAPAYDETFERECTFTPATNKTSAVEYQDPYASVVVYDRLHENLPRSMAAMSQQSVARERKHQEETTAELTFTPRISKTSSLIVERKRQESSSVLMELSPTSRLYRQGTRDNTDRLNANTDSEESTSRRRGQQQQAPAGQMPAGAQSGDQPCYKPNINPNSRAIWEKLARSVVEVEGQHATNTAPQHRRNLNTSASEAKSARELLWEKKQREKEQYLTKLKETLLNKEVEECTFAPQGTTSNLYRHDTSSASFYPADFADRENMWVQQRDRNLEEMKHEKEKSQLEGCTFQPIIHKEVPYGAAFVANAAGFERHVQRLNTVRQQREMERQKKPAQQYKATTTVAVPFVLGKERQERERMRREVRDSDDEGIPALRPPINYDEWSQVRAGLDDDVDPRYRHYGDNERPAFAAEGPRRDKEGDRSQQRYYRHDGDDEMEANDETTFYVHRPTGSSSLPPRERQDHLSNAGRRQARLEYNTTSPVDYIINNHQSILRHAR